jgi:hypothetical protein
MAVRVLSWLTEQQAAGYEIGRAKSDSFQPLLMPYRFHKNRWVSDETTSPGVLNGA